MATRVCGRGKTKWGADITAWISDFDHKYFSDYFEDKDLMVTIRKDEGYFSKGKSTYAVCEPTDCSMVFNPDIFRECVVGEIRDTVLHELLHLFIFYTYKHGLSEFDDKTATFKAWSKLLNCPIGARNLVDQKLADIKTEKFKTCGLCGSIVKKTRCKCGSTWTKTYDTSDRKA